MLPYVRFNRCPDNSKCSIKASDQHKLRSTFKSTLLVKSETITTITRGQDTNSSARDYHLPALSPLAVAAETTTASGSSLAPNLSADTTPPVSPPSHHPQQIPKNSQLFVRADALPLLRPPRSLVPAVASTHNNRDSRWACIARRCADETSLSDA